METFGGSLHALPTMTVTALRAQAKFCTSDCYARIMNLTYSFTGVLHGAELSWFMEG